MSTNPYFNTINYQPEQDLQESLIIESIKIYGQDFIYVKRDSVAEDVIYSEDPLSKFVDTYDIEMYISTVDDFEGEGDLFSKFGVEIRDRATLVVAQSRFISACDRELIRPREGDIIYFPLTKGIFEIHHVEDESIFYQLGRLHVFTLTIEQFEYSNELFQTGYTDIDEIANNSQYSYELILNTGSGIFLKDESIYVGSSLSTSSVTAKVHSLDSVNKKLRIMNIKGQFLPGQTITGDTSGASWTIGSGDDQQLIQDTLADNLELEESADNDIFDFSEVDPYSEGDY